MDGEQANLLCPYTTHSYNIPLSHELVYSLSVNADSNVMDSLSIYEGVNVDPLYIKAAPFTIITTPTIITTTNGDVITSITNGHIYSNITSDGGVTNTNLATNGIVTFPGINNGRRYMVLPLASNSHRIVISNNSEQIENYTINLAEYLGKNPDTLRLLTAPQKMGYFDSADDPRYFWMHVPPNKNLLVEAESRRSGVWTATAAAATPYGSGVAGFTSFFNVPQTISINSDKSEYLAVSTRNVSSIRSGIAQTTNVRFTFSFVDP